MLSVEPVPYPLGQVGSSQPTWIQIRHTLEHLRLLAAVAVLTRSLEIVQGVCTAQCFGNNVVCCGGLTGTTAEP